MLKVSNSNRNFAGSLSLRMGFKLARKLSRVDLLCSARSFQQAVVKELAADFAFKRAQAYV